MTSVTTALDSLTGNLRPDDKAKLSAVATQFEALFVRQMLEAARKTDFGGDMFGGQAMQTFRQMQDERFADLTAKTGVLGFAKMIESQLARFVDVAGTPATSAAAQPPQES